MDSQMRIRSYIPKFSLVTLIILVLFVIGYFSGFRAGFDSGLQRLAADTIYAEYYPVADLVTPLKGGGAQKEIEYDTLVNLIKTTIHPQEWNHIVNIHPIPESRQLVVFQTAPTHAKIVDLLTTLRDNYELFKQNMADGKCAYCGNAPLPAKAGERCVACSQERHDLTADRPSAAVLRPY